MKNRGARTGSQDGDCDDLILHSEVEVVMSRLETGKSHGMDGVAADMLRADGEELIKQLLQARCRVWETEE